MTSAERLRPEARPTHLSQLYDDQRKAFDKIVALLTTAVNDPATPDQTRRPMPFLDPNRSSRAILIDGQRGTGKTTLLMTLIAALLGVEVGPKEAWPTAVRELRPGLVWLESLDMEPLDRSTNLLGALLARLEEAVGREVIDPGAEPTAPPSLLTPGAAQHEALKGLVELQTHASATFDGNLRARAASLDPDNFAVESRRAERMRLGLPAKFAAVVRTLSVTVQRARNAPRPPVFVLPVDDLDLNPSGAVPLLELVRAVHSPHLIVLMVGDLRILETALRMKYERQYAEASGQGCVSERFRDEIDELAANAARKHLPQEQRIHLAPVPPWRALEVIPFGGEGTHSLLNLFGQRPLAADEVGFARGDDSVPAPEMTIRDAFEWMTRPSPIPHVTWWEIFRLPMREIVDLQLEASRSDNDPQAVLAEFGGRRFKSRFEGGATFDSMLRPKLNWSTVTMAGQPPIESATIRGWSSSSPLDVRTRELGMLFSALDLRDVRAQYDMLNLRPESPNTLRRTIVPDSTQCIDWPMPHHNTFWGTEWAAIRLANADRVWADQPDRWFGSWIATMTTVLEEALAGGSWLEVPTTWDEIRARLAALTDRSITHRWHAQVLVLSTPEMGMSITTATTMWRLGRRRRDLRVRDLALSIRAERWLPESVWPQRDEWQPPGTKRTTRTPS